MPIMTQREIKNEFEQRHGKGVIMPDGNVMYYADGSIREVDGGGNGHAEDLPPIDRARNKVRYWQSLLTIHQNHLAAVRQNLLNIAKSMEKTGNLIDTTAEEAEMASLIKKVKAAAKGRAEAEKELEPLLPPRFKKEVNSDVALKAYKIRELLRRNMV